MTLILHKGILSRKCCKMKCSGKKFLIFSYKYKSKEQEGVTYLCKLRVEIYLQSIR